MGGGEGSGNQIFFIIPYHFPFLKAKKKSLEKLHIRAGLEHDVFSILSHALTYE